MLKEREKKINEFLNKELRDYYNDENTSGYIYKFVREKDKKFGCIRNGVFKFYKKLDFPFDKVANAVTESHNFKSLLGLKELEQYINTHL